MTRTRLPLQLSVEVTTAAGTRFQLADDRAPTDRLLSPVITDEIGTGFKSANGSLRRRFDIQYPDLGLVDTWTFVGADGSVAWEGRNAEMPRSLTDRSVIGVSLEGWMQHAHDRPFREIYVDRDLNAWTDPSLGRQAALLTAGFNPTAGQVASDVANATSGVVTGYDGAYVANKPVSDAWYDAGPGLTIGRIDYSWVVQAGGLDPANANFNWSVNVSNDDKSTATQGTANLRAAGPSAGSFTPSLLYRYAFLQQYFNATSVLSDGGHYGIAWYNMAVYGSHGLSLYTGDAGQPPGVIASDVIKDIARRFAPKLNTAGVKTTTYPIQHLTFKDLTDPYDAFAQVNKYHLWNLAVWEDKTLSFSGYDLDDYDWQIRAGEDGATFEAQGMSTDNLFNGIVVSYTDLLTGVKNILMPDVYSQLQSTDLLNPWSMHGIDRWMTIELSTPTIQSQAIDIGRTALAEANRPKGPGTLTTKGYIKDRQGNWQPGWKVRSGDTVAVLNAGDALIDAPRLIHAKTWDCDSHTLTMAVDAPPDRLPAYMDRITNALQARGLT